VNLHRHANSFSKISEAEETKVPLSRTLEELKMSTFSSASFSSTKIRVDDKSKGISVVTQAQEFEVQRKALSSKVNKRHSLSHVVFEREPHERKAKAIRRGSDTSPFISEMIAAKIQNRQRWGMSIKRSKSDPLVGESPTSKMSPGQPHEKTVQARRGSGSEAHIGRTLSSPAEIAVDPSTQEHEACAAGVHKCMPGKHGRVDAAVTAASNHNNPRGKVHKGTGAPARKHASYDVHGSYESEAQAMEMLFGLMVSLVLSAGFIVIFWGGMF
jgi:hypothetical protein